MINILINSHIFLAKSILNRFATYENGYKIIYFFDYHNKLERKMTTEAFNTEFGYYYDCNEKTLSRYSESLVGNVIKKLEDIYETKHRDFQLSDKEIEVLKRYISYQLIRDDWMMDIVRHSFVKSVYKMKYLSMEEFHKRISVMEYYASIDNRNMKNLFIERELKENVFYSTIKDKAMIVYFNYSDLGFLNSSSCSSFFVNSKFHYLMNTTLSPKICLALCEKSSLSELFGKETDFYVSFISNNDFVFNYNSNVYDTASKHEPYMLVGRKEDLEKTLDFIGVKYVVVKKNDK